MTSQSNLHNIETGQIYWMQIKSTVPHPHVVIQLDPNNPSQITVCAITTNMHKANLPGNIILEIGEGNLTKQSIVDVSKVFEVHQSQLGEYVGELTPDKVIAIHQGINLLSKSYFSQRYPM